MPRTSGIVVLAAALCTGVARADDETTLLPDVSVHLRAARYEPTEPDFMWTGWIGGGAGLVRSHHATAYFTGEVETIIGNVKRAFDANQANYHLELGVDRPVGDRALNLFFHHVSRHVIDRPKDESVDWNVLGVRGSTPLPKPFPAKTRLTLGIGHTTRASLIAYRWEGTARLESDLVRGSWGALYLDAHARFVTTERSLGFPRDHFVDLLEEAGVRFTRDGRSLALFAAYEHRNDVVLDVLGARDRLLLGFQVGYGPSRDLGYPQ